jgi:ribosome-binding factor A
MTFSRVDRVNELIKDSLAKIIHEEADMPLGVFLTVVKVDTSKDLRYARVFVSVFPEKYFGKTLQHLAKKAYFLQGSLNKRLRMKPLPRIEFTADKTEVEADKIEKVLKGISDE